MADLNLEEMIALARRTKDWKPFKSNHFFSFRDNEGYNGYAGMVEDFVISIQMKKSWLRKAYRIILYSSKPELSGKGPLGITDPAYSSEMEEVYDIAARAWDTKVECTRLEEIQRARNAIKK